MKRPIALAAALVLAAAGSACAKKKTKGSAEILSAQQALVRVDDAMARHQLRKAKTILGKVQFTTDERGEYEPLVRLALADATYYLGDDLSLIEARSKYLDFVTLYGDHPKAPYAQFQAGMCSVKQIYSATRDQAQTKVAIADFQVVSDRWPTSDFARAARQFLGKGRDGLAEHEFIVGSFYRKKKSYDAATQRFKDLLETYPEYRQKDKVFYWLGWTLQKNRNESDARTYLDRVVTEYPMSKYAKMAQQMLDESAKRDLAKEGG
ncbi:MAG TPA: outer membrane protein assembly factor BamD [Candidatus Polarisedimenticolaceae bacterium]|nr:outer membrane protein assembly factor BamD [Candidatus Polarisedimenticolaceae bacterium]